MRVGDYPVCTLKVAAADSLEEVGAIMSPLVFPGRILAWDHLSMQMVENLAFSGILMSNRHQFNPDLYNWNRVKVGYCDGSSFTGDVQAVNPAILSGCGLTSILHCDSFKALLPVGAKVKCFSDAGYLLV
ncbi:hypothetical protein KY290_025176 [Solanum tuberosum]|uniref:Pectin acetylesterase n=1 Tax=Solanum tuberosum TaxID=4113 RepID=A0ABQ7USS7_SOLTU|nr:hypothetical protein KY284_023980 [Solanum tuberosum]KAH0754906.1 hypothetical protein KY290_025176 [Solanum tuberosum]